MYICRKNSLSFARKIVCCQRVPEHTWQIKLRELWELMLDEKCKKMDSLNVLYMSKRQRARGNECFQENRNFWVPKTDWVHKLEENMIFTPGSRP